ncbi:phosphotransferase [Virgibacillus doumboii]|uniref:phosphotransferase n=1 Tax=Virgibacillus doumboii TaxID=2697503 RepID=UPI0013DF9381|nr:phosphotransferase [Virgibacillus doumboii]
MERINKIAWAYGIRPFKVDQISKRVFRVSDGNYEYALKESKLTEKELEAWEYVFHQAYSQNLTGILPVYLTKNSRLYTFHKQTYYYLTPWIPSMEISEKEAIKTLYDTIGGIHANTKRTQSIQTESAINSFTEYQKACANLRAQSLYYVELFEKNRFMSPFELLACTQYRLMDQVLFVLNNHIEQFIKAVEENEWNYSLCHGNLNLSHLIQHNYTYIINWEKAKFDNAVMDLSVFMKQQVRYYDRTPEQLTEAFSAYMSKNELTKSELHLLAIYLLDPFSYINLIEAYSDNPANDTMINQTIALQQVSRQLHMGLKWSDYIEKELISSSTEDN